jgi:hypothetical protein
MLYPLLRDRLASPTLVWGLVTAVAWQGRHFQLVISYAAIALISVWYANSVIHHVSTEARIDAQGGLRAPVLRSPTPFNLGNLIRTLYYFSQHRNHEIWWQWFGTHGNKNRPWTVETVMAGQRLVLTADEDNIKAILATQFADYGKGPQFRKEWKDFLGLSMCLRQSL